MTDTWSVHTGDDQAQKGSGRCFNNLSTSF
jgi:hypothetical protein